MTFPLTLYAVLPITGLGKRGRGTLGGNGLGALYTIVLLLSRNQCLKLLLLPIFNYGNPEMTGAIHV